jgi:DNA processing protein
VTACDACLRRAHLIGLLAPRIADLLDRPGRRAPGLLGLPEADLLAGVAGRDSDEVRAALRRFDVDAERDRLAALGVHAGCRHGSGYPESLSDLTDAPAVLFSTSPTPLGEGDPGPAVAIVGTRAASPYGLEVAHALGRGLAAAGVTVVSGLALGIDAAAHRGCLDGNGHTIAVLACGVDVPYPLRHRHLYERIVDRGAVVAELPAGQRPFRWSFPARNRIMAGLADMVVVVEAADPSGSLITSEFARDLGRAVGAVPGRITSRMAAGTNGLLRDGAIPVTGVTDVLDELFGVGVRPAGSERQAAGKEAPPLRGDLRRVLDAVEAGAAAGRIAAATGLSASTVRASLARLEAMGLVARSGLGSYERTADLR